MSLPQPSPAPTGPVAASPSPVQAPPDPFPAAPGPALLPRRGASLRLRVGSTFAFDAHMDVAPLRLLAIGALVSSILLSVPPIIEAARKRKKDHVR